MRTLIVAMGMAALAATPVLAQTGLARATASTNAGTTATAQGNTTLPSSAVGAEPVLTSPATTDASGSGNVAGAGTGFGTNTTTQDVRAAQGAAPFGPGGSFSNDSGNSALGTSPGQSSSGTAAGNSSAGIGADSSSLGTNLPGAANTGTVTLVPEGTVSVIAGGSTGARIVNPSASQGAVTSATNTPLFDQAARDARAREQRRRARGDEPRVYGIAPNTERDLTWQMPDDRIIRY